MAVFRSIPSRPETLVRIQEGRDRRRLYKRLERVGKHIKRRIQYNINGRILQRRTSKLYRSFDWKVFPVGEGLGVKVFSDVVYSKIHDEGGMAGRNRSVRIPKRKYAKKAVVAAGPFIRRQLKQYMGELVK